MQNQLKVQKKYTKYTAVLPAHFYQLIRSSARVVTRPSFANLAKMIGKDRKMENSNVQAASLKKNQEN